MYSNKIKDTTRFNSHQIKNNGSANKLNSIIKNKKLIAFFQFIIIISFLAYWINFNSTKISRNLWILFFYCFPSEFLIGILPHEPILIFFGKFYTPLVVASVSIIGTVMAEGLNYSFFSIFSDKEIIQKINNKNIVKKLTKLFNKAPFWAIWIAGFTPIPFYPIRFLVVTTNYPIQKYLLGVFLSRYPRFYLLALIGFVFEIPNYIIIALFIITIALVYIQFLKVLIKKILKRNE